MLKDQNVQHFLSEIEPFRTFPHVWFVCGGWAIDLFLDRCSREHSDVEVGIWRADQKVLHSFFKNRHKLYIKDTQKKPWDEFHELALPVHEIYAGNSEILLNEKDGEEWVYRRNNTIRRPVNRAIYHHADLGLLYLAPEICLLYKSRHLREKDHADFQKVFPQLKEGPRDWLVSAINAADPQHPWLAQ